MMDLLRFDIRSGKNYIRLRKKELTNLTKRQRCDTDSALTKSKTVAFNLLYVTLIKKKVPDSFSGNAPGFTDLHSITSVLLLS